MFHTMPAEYFFKISRNSQVSSYEFLGNIKEMFPGL